MSAVFQHDGDKRAQQTNTVSGELIRSSVEMSRGQHQSNIRVGENFSQTTICGMSSPRVSIFGSWAQTVVALGNTTWKSGSSFLSPAVLQRNSEGSVKSGEKAANRWIQLQRETGMSSMCYSVKMERSHTPQSHPSALVTADNFVSKKTKLPWFAPRMKWKHSIC